MLRVCLVGDIWMNVLSHQLSVTLIISVENVVFTLFTNSPYRIDNEAAQANGASGM